MNRSQPRDLSIGTRDACDQLMNYGRVACDEVLDVLDALVTLNDSLHNDMHPTVLESDIAQLRDKVEKLARYTQEQAK